MIPFILIGIGSYLVYDSQEKKFANGGKVMRNISQLTEEELAKIGDMIGYVPSAAKHKARRFLYGCQNKLKNWDYDEVVNYGDMHKVVAVFKYLQSINVEII